MPSTFPYQEPITVPLLKPSTSPTTDPSQSPSNKPSKLTSTIPSVNTSKDRSSVSSYLTGLNPFRAPSEQQFGALQEERRKTIEQVKSLVNIIS